LVLALLPAIYALFFSQHPCGPKGYALEWTTQLTGLNDWGFRHLLLQDRECLWGVHGLVRVTPLNRLSYFRAAVTMLLKVQSRYTSVWQAASSFWLEMEVADFLNVSHVQFVSTGTAALVVALQTLGLGPGDEVIVPTYTWFSTASSVTTVGAIPVMADIDETLGMSPEGLTAAITNRTRAVIVVHMRGVPADVRAIKEITDSRGLFLIEDNAQSFGASIGGKFAGTFGDMGITSVNPSKVFHAGGQGGLVWLVSPDEYLTERMVWAVENGIAGWNGLSRLPSFKRSFKKSNTSSSLSSSSEVPFAGHCYRSPSEWHASFLRHELTQVPHLTRRLQELKKAFIGRLHARYHGVLQRVQDIDGDRSYTITLLLWSADHVQILKDYLLSEGVMGVDTTFWPTHYLPHASALMNKVSFHPSGFPWMTEEDKRPLELSQFDKSNSIMRRILTIKVGYYLTKGMMEFAADLVNAFLSEMGQDDYCNVTRPATE